MNSHKFFRFTIQSENLDPKELQRNINLQCEIFHKGEILAKKINDKVFEHAPQKTNRWMYCAEDNSEISSEDFVLHQLEILTDHLSELNYYIVRGMALLEIVIYAGNATDFNLTTNHISELNKLGLGMSISFC